jgi:diguanylate cyclase (GGDEF)-like protein
MTIEVDKQLLSTKVRTLTDKSVKMTTIAYKDALTGLSNRYSLFTKMNQLIQSNQAFIVVFIDLDNLKMINDTYGHSKGDVYLKEFARSLQDTVNDQDNVYRFAGDEFVCLIEMDIATFKQTLFEEEVNRAIVMSIPFVGMSMGTAYYPNDGSNPDSLITKADQNMYVEKRQKKTR